LGAGSLAAGSIPLLSRPALAHGGALDEDARHFRFVAFSFPSDEETPSEAFGLEGNGVFDDEGIHWAGGQFLHLTWPPPSTHLASGRWRDKRFVSFEDGFGSREVIEAGILTMVVRMIPGGGSEVDPFDATMQVVCNIGFAGIGTGLNEGVYLTLPDGSTFEPSVPPLGLTFISTEH
jgi:hypothetical protein